MEEVLSILERLVAVPSVLGASNADIVGLVTGLMPGSVKAWRVPSPLGDAEGLILSAGPDGPGGLVLSGHLDVVSVEGQAWASDPFRLRRADGRLYGRGSCDMKGFVACALAQVARHAEAQPPQPLHVVLSADEESTCRSVETLVRSLGDLSPVRGVIVGEPTGMAPVDRHKSSATHRVQVRGRAVHASLADRGVNAVSVAARLVGWLDAETKRAVAAAGPEGDFDLNHALHSATTIQGGAAVNTIPESCCFDWDMRLMPGEDVAEITARFDAFAAMLAKEAGADVTRNSVADFPGLEPRETTPFRAKVLQDSRASGFAAMPYGTEAGHFQRAGFDTVVCGPGSADQAHVADEFVTEVQLGLCLSFLSELISGTGV